jgi:hypothetical protein
LRKAIRAQHMSLFRRIALVVIAVTRAKGSLAVVAMSWCALPHCVKCSCLSFKGAAPA